MRKVPYCSNNRKGLTLVEVIVVLVIVATLAAIMVPSLIGYIKKSSVMADQLTVF